MANLPTFSDIPGGKFPAAVVGGAPDATMVPFGDIYFSFDFSTQFSYLLSNEHGVDVTSNSYGNSDVDNDGMDAASQEADIWDTEFGGKTTPVFSTGNGAPGFGTVDASVSSRRHQDRRLDAVRRHRLGLDQASTARSTTTMSRTGPTAGQERPAAPASTSLPTVPTRPAR